MVKEKNVSLGMVVLVALVVSVVASVATLAITGNTIKVNPLATGTGTAGTEIYTKAEIDNLFKGYYTKSLVEGLIASAITNFYTKAEVDQKLAEVSGGGGTADNSKACNADGDCEINNAVISSYIKTDRIKPKYEVGVLYLLVVIMVQR